MYLFAFLATPWHRAADKGFVYDILLNILSCVCVLVYERECANNHLYYEMNARHDEMTNE